MTLPEDRDRPRRVLSVLSPPVRRAEFWIIQVLVVAIAFGHVLVEAVGVADVDALKAVPVSLNLLPVGYAAVIFGLRGSLPTALWAVCLALPNAFLLHGGGERIAELWQLGLVVVVGVLLGHRVDREHRSRREIDRYERERRRVVEEYAGRTLAALEEERRRIAMELHDGPLQATMVLWRRLDPHGGGTPATAREKLLAAQAAVEDFAGDIRRFSRELRPSVLDDLGLLPALRAEVTSFEERTGISSSLVVRGPTVEELSTDVALMLLRVCQEALRNVERHSRARHVVVEVVADPCRITMRVTDDGCGIPALPAPTELVQSNRLGIVGMLERARLAGGTCNVSPGSPRGTSVQVAVPLGQG